MRSSGNNDNSVILFGRHAGISSLLQCLGRLSQPTAYWRDSRPRHCSRADIPAWRPQKSHYCIIIFRYWKLLADIGKCGIRHPTTVSSMRTLPQIVKIQNRHISAMCKNKAPVRKHIGSKPFLTWHCHRRKRNAIGPIIIIIINMGTLVTVLPLLRNRIADIGKSEWFTCSNSIYRFLEIILFYRHQEIIRIIQILKIVYDIVKCNHIHHISMDKYSNAWAHILEN